MKITYFCSGLMDKKFQEEQKNETDHILVIPAIQVFDILSPLCGRNDILFAQCSSILHVICPAHR